MGSGTSNQNGEPSNPEVEYNVHGLYYWPGKMIPYKNWPSAILNTGTGGTYDEVTIVEGGAKSKRAKMMARFQRLIDSHSDIDLHNVLPEKLHQMWKKRNEGFTNNGIEVTETSPAEELKKKIQETDTLPVDSHVNRNSAPERLNCNCNQPLPNSEIESEPTNSIKKAHSCEQSTPLLMVTSQKQKLCSEIDKDFEFENRWRNAEGYPFENLVFSGGGIKGYAYIGAIKALEDAGIMPNIKRFAGSSAGAMCIACLAVGYSAQDVSRFFYVDLKETFNDQRCAPICCVPKLYTRYGIHPAKRYSKGLGDILANKTGNPDLTFKEFHERYDKELCIVVCNITKMCAEYCHHTTTPDLPIRQAVRMSMAVPCIYEPPVMLIDGQPNYYVDGSAGDHFPLHCFDGPNIGSNLNSPPSEKTLGFYALSEKDTEHLMWQNAFGKTIPRHYRPAYLPDSKLATRQLKEHIKQRKRTNRNFNEKAFLNQLEKFSHASLEHLGLRMKHYEAPNKTHLETTNIIHFLVANLESLLISQVISNLKPEDENRTIPINCGYIESHDYDIEPADREFMLKQGYQSARTFLQNYVNKKPVRRESSV